MEQMKKLERNSFILAKPVSVRMERESRAAYRSTKEVKMRIIGQKQ